ncbi:MAG: glycosyltransferase family protein [Nitrospinota bacterium]
MKRIFYFISGHGYGHAVRSAQVVRELYNRGVKSTIISSTRRCIFDVNLKNVDFDYHFLESDVGVCQKTSLDVDIAATYDRWTKRLSGEAGWVTKIMELAKKAKPEAVVSDIVPSAFVFARKAGLPSLLVASFTWDWILRHYSGDDTRFAALSDELRDRYMMADGMIYTPLSFSLPPVEPQYFVSLIGKRCPLSREEVRKRLNLDGRPAFLVSFGGLGVSGVETMSFDRMKEYQFIFLDSEPSRRGNVITFTDRDATHEELVAASDAIITKPGYGVCTEAILNKRPMIYTSRGRFAEYKPLVEEAKRYIPMRYISNEELFSGGLREKLKDLPQFHDGLLTDTGNGAIEAAEIIASEQGGQQISAKPNK